MANGTCSVEGCEQGVLSRGFCNKHYIRSRKYGDPLADYTRRKQEKLCAVEGCEKSARNRGWCSMHYERWRLHGTTDSRPKPTIEERFWSKVVKSDGCWIWTGALTEGYGSIGLTGGKKAGSIHAHVYSYTLNVGPVPAGKEIDHKCRVRACVNPAHLQAVTHGQNAENITARSNTSTGVRGVGYDKRRSRFYVRATAGGRTHFGGHYGTLAEAEAAAIALRNRVMTNNLADRSLVAQQPEQE